MPFPDNDCTNFSSQVLRAGGFPNNPSNATPYNQNDPHQWWYDPILGFWPYYSSVTWRATPEFVDEYVPFRSTEFQFKNHIGQMIKGDLLALDLQDENGRYGHDGIPDHMRVVLDWNYTSPFSIDYSGTGDNFVMSPALTLLIDQHSIDRWHVPWTYNFISMDDVYAYIHIIKN